MHDGEVAVPEIRYAKSGDASIAYQIVGDGPVDLVLVWGTMSHLEFFWEDPFTSYFMERLASFSRLILFDKRGCGLSDRFSNQPTLEERMDDVRAVMDEVGSERAVIFGESEGGPMSILFAATYPERTIGLVLFGPIVRWVDETFEGAFRPQEFAELVDAFAQGWGRGDFIAWVAPSFAKLAPDVVAESGGRFERAAMSPGAFRQVVAMNADIDVRSIAGSVTVPTLIMHRTGDQVVKVQQGRWLADHIAGATYIEFEGDDHLMSAGDPEPILARTEEFVTGSRRAQTPERAVATVLFTDIVDSTARAAELGDGRWRSVLDRHEAIVRRELNRHRGKEIKTTGDGFLATFDGPARAVRCASDINRSIAIAGVQVRAGLHTGEVELRGDDIGGIAVHIASRICALAAGGQILASRTVKDLVAGSGISFSELGEYTLKGVPDSWQVYDAFAN
jgi:class 3 adenylate cyclase